MPTIRLPAALRRLMDTPVASMALDAATVGEALEALLASHPALRPTLFDGQNELRRFVRIYVGEEPIEALGGLSAPLGPTDDILLLPPIAGG